MDKQHIIMKIDEITQLNRDNIIRVAKHIWDNPETGYREVKTSRFLQQEFEKLGYDVVEMVDIPGFYADLDTGREGPSLAILAELDSIICAGHPAKDQQTNAVHACGHHTQCGYLVGVAAILKNVDILEELCGRIRFIAVPAEELIELAFRQTLREKGTIKYYGGKVEFLYRGVFDSIDAAMMVHSGNNIEGDKALEIYSGNNGCVTKTVTYTGKAAHAAGGPDKAINALYAATLGMQAINSIRETFVETNMTRVHPIITSGGVAVNVIPETVTMETYVRGSSPDAIVYENTKVNRALAGAAVAMGAKVHIEDTPGYMPLINNTELNNLAAETASDILGSVNILVNDKWSAGSTDMGDLSCVLPVIQPGGGGGEGIGHGENYNVKNYDTACISSARFLSFMTYRLLSNNGAELKQIKKEFTPFCSSYEEFFKFIDKLFLCEDLVEYDSDTATVKWS